MRDYKLTLNLVTNEKPGEKIFKQYDTGNEIELELYQNEHLNADEKLVLSSESVLAFFKRADGQVLQKNCTIRNGNIIVKTSKDVLGVPGILELECMVKKGDVETTTTRMTFTVKESIARDGVIEEDPRYYADLVTELLDVRDNVKAETIGKIEEVASQLEESKKYQRYRSVASVLLAELYRKLRMKENVLICCQGDSLTMGIDMQSSDKRPPSTQPDDLGNMPTPTMTRATKTYPEALEEVLKNLYGSDKISIINHGWSGDTTALGNWRWKNPTGANLTILMYGTNDARVYSVSEYVSNYRKIIEKTISQGSAIILVIPPKFRNSFGDGTQNEYWNAEKVAIYANAVNFLGQEYGIPVFDMSEALANMDTSIYSDGIHFNGTGYTVIAKKLVSIFIGKGIVSPTKVNSGQSISVRPQVENLLIKYSNYQSTTGMPTPSEIEVGKGINIGIPEGGEVIYSFYSEIDNLCIVPSLSFLSNPNVEISLDFGIQIPEPTIDYSLLYNRSVDYKPTNPISITKNDCNWGLINDKYSMAGIRNIRSDKFILATTKGWHTLKIKCTGGSVALFGIDFVSWLSLNTKLKAENKMYVKTLADSTDISSSVISFKEIFDAIQYENNTDNYAYNVPLKVSIFNSDKNVLIYYLNVNISVANGCKISKAEKHDFQDVVNLYREIDTISNTTTDLTINWKGQINRMSTIIIERV